MSKDTIYRQDAIDALHMHLMYRMGTDSNKKRLDDWINGVPSVQPEPHWIPTSKERPPQHKEIWITDDLGCVELVYGKDGMWLDDIDCYTEREIVA